jgi:hypothetical protein
MTNEYDRSLLLTFLGWYENAHPCASYDLPLLAPRPEDVDAFLAACPSRAAPDVREELRKETDADPAEMRANLLAALKPLPRDEQFRVHHAMEQSVAHGMRVLGREEPQRFWRVYGEDSGYQAWGCNSRGKAQTLPIGKVHFTRAEAEADGRASGLEEWKPPGGKR